MVYTWNKNNFQTFFVVAIHEEWMNNSKKYDIHVAM